MRWDPKVDWLHLPHLSILYNQKMPWFYWKNIRRSLNGGSWWPLVFSVQRVCWLNRTARFCSLCCIHRHLVCWKSYRNTDYWKGDIQRAAMWWEVFIHTCMYWSCWFLLDSDCCQWNFIKWELFHTFIFIQLRICGSVVLPVDCKYPQYEGELSKARIKGSSAGRLCL